MKNSTCIFENIVGENIIPSFASFNSFPGTSSFSFSQIVKSLIAVTHIPQIHTHTMCVFPNIEIKHVLNINWTMILIWTKPMHSLVQYPKGSNSDMDTLTVNNCTWIRLKTYTRRGESFITIEILRSYSLLVKVWTQG